MLRSVVPHSWSKLVFLNTWWIQTAANFNWYRSHSHMLYVNVEDNMQQISVCLTVYRAAPSPLIDQLHALSYPAHPQINTTGVWIWRDEFAHSCGCNCGGVFAHIWQESLSIQLSSERWKLMRAWWKERWNKRAPGGKKVPQSKYNRRHEWLSLLSLRWWRRDGEICRKKKGIAGE